MDVWSGAISLDEQTQLTGKATRRVGLGIILSYHI
jgi:hypothetical protein